MHKNIITIQPQKIYLCHMYSCWIIYCLLSFRLIHFIFLGVGLYNLCGVICDITWNILCGVFKLSNKRSIIITLPKQYMHKNIITIQQQNTYLCHLYFYCILFCLLSFWLIRFIFLGVWLHKLCGIICDINWNILCGVLNDKKKKHNDGVTKTIES